MVDILQFVFSEHSSAILHAHSQCGKLEATVFFLECVFSISFDLVQAMSVNVTKW